MHITRNDLSQKIRAGVIKELAPLLADAVDLGTQMKQAHWTVKGPSFMQLHELFDTIAEEAGEWADLIAERIAQLGGTPIGTSRHVAKESRLAEYPSTASKGSDHVRLVAERLAAFGASVRGAIDATDELGDKDAADICTEISRAADKQLWFVESHSSKFQ